MSKTITVWGSPGSGKSMFCCILAKALTRDKRKAIIISGEPGTPMLPVWLPEQIPTPAASIGQVLTSVEIDTSLVASHVTVLKNYPYIGLMGYCAGEPIPTTIRTSPRMSCIWPIRAFGRFPWSRWWQGRRTITPFRRWTCLN